MSTFPHLQESDLVRRDFQPQRAKSKVLHRAPANAALFYKLLDQITDGQIILHTPWGEERSFGPSGSTPAVHWNIHQKDCGDRILHGGSLALGETFMDGSWDVDDDRICEFIGILLRNDLEMKIRLSLSLTLALAVRSLLYSPRFLINRWRSIHHHYDLSNDFFELFLDPSMTYSCGYQRSPNDSLELMQEQKYELVANKLGLRRGMRLIDIGCGWGGMLLYAGNRYPELTGTGITLSSEQLRVVNERLEHACLAKRFNAQLCDYRNVRGTFDALVSIGMFEHVGRACYRDYMKHVNQLLRPGGTGLLHTIGVPHAASVKPDAWFDRYIFPGSRLPRLEEIVSEMHRAKLLVGHVENLKPHYAETLKKWRENFRHNYRRIQALGPQFNGRFLRMWNYYLQNAEAGFRYGDMQLYQVLFAKGRAWSFPSTFRWQLSHSPNATNFLH